mmetsp:Transcript_117794/g.375543  ORF Transcript_117794/g.375543 Transcript_117794/m.375543 type:complete len:202 (-) Transcript_117794:415-1020(-)
MPVLLLQLLAHLSHQLVPHFQQSLLLGFCLSHFKQVRAKNRYRASGILNATGTDGHLHSCVFQRGRQYDLSRAHDPLWSRCQFHPNNKRDYAQRFPLQAEVSSMTILFSSQRGLEPLRELVGPRHNGIRKQAAAREEAPAEPQAITDELEVNIPGEHHEAQLVLPPAATVLLRVHHQSPLLQLPLARLADQPQTANFFDGK